MATWWARGLGLLFAVAGAFLWAVNLTSLQPLTEEPVARITGSNNEAWARDLRWSAALAVLLGLVLVFQGNWVRSALAVVGVGGLLAADVQLDRADASGSRAQLWTVVIASACVLGLALVGVALRAWSQPNPSVLVIAAFVAATLAPQAAAAEGPQTIDPVQLRMPATLTASLLAAVAVSCALAAAPTVGRFARFVAAAFVACFGGFLLLRPVPTDGARAFLWIVSGGLMLLTVALLCTGLPDDWRPGLRHLGVAAVSIFVYPFVTLFVMLLTWNVFTNVAENLTRLAGNAPKYYADEDHLAALVGVTVGLIFSAAFLAKDRLQRFALDHPLDPLVSARQQDRETGLGAWMVED